jgi:CheY-like chemotaxis protein
MNKFRLRDECQVLLTELKTYFGDKNIIQITVDPVLPDLFEGAGEPLLNKLRVLAQFLTGNVVNGIIAFELKPAGGNGSETAIQVVATGSGTPGANIPKLEKSQTQLLSEFKVLNPHFTNDLILVTADNNIRLELIINLRVAGAAPVKGKAAFKGKKILLVEDNEVNVIVFSSFLEDWGVDQTTVENGAVAVASARSTEFDAILMDIHMPVMDGIEAIRQIRRFNQDIPIIVLSAASHTEDIEMAMNMGGSAFLKKPVSSWELYAVLAKHLN